MLRYQESTSIIIGARILGIPVLLSLVPYQNVSLHVVSCLEHCLEHQYMMKIDITWSCIITVVTTHSI